MRLVQRLVVRARDTARAIENKAAAVVVTPGASTSSSSYFSLAAVANGGDGGEGGEEAAAARLMMARIDSTLRWLCQELLRQLYPGAPFSREVSELVTVTGGGESL